MPSYTPNINLFKWNTSTDGNQIFNIDQSLNNNWDTIDDYVNSLSVRLNGIEASVQQAINGAISDMNSVVGGLATVPVGTILSIGYLPTTTIPLPDGYLLCNGAAVQRTGIYANLFHKIGTNFGAGDGYSSFNLPYLQDNRALSGTSNGVGQQSNKYSKQITISVSGTTSTGGNHQHGYLMTDGHFGVGAATDWGGSHSHTFSASGSDTLANLGWNFLNVIFIIKY